MSVVYEWTIETVDDHGDIVDVDHREVCPALSALKQNQQLALVCEEYRGSRHSKGWAYVKYGALPEFCLDASDAPLRRIPPRYRREFERVQHAANREGGARRIGSTPRTKTYIPALTPDRVCNTLLAP